LQIGDICLFDLLKDKKMCTTNVHIIRTRKRGRQWSMKKRVSVAIGFVAVIMRLFCVWVP
jgi:hypothetical protein